MFEASAVIVCHARRSSPTPTWASFKKKLQKINGLARAGARAGCFFSVKCFFGKKMYIFLRRKEKPLDGHHELRASISLTTFDTALGNWQQHTIQQQ